MTEELITLAKITIPHGLKGEVKIHIIGEPKNLPNYDYFYLKGQKTNISFRGFKKKQAIAKIENISDRNQAESLKHSEIQISKSQLPELESDEFYIDDLIGLTAYDQSENKIGIITNITNHGASDIIEITSENGKKTEYPFLDEVFTNINLEKNTIQINIPEIL